MSRIRIIDLLNDQKEGIREGLTNFGRIVKCSGWVRTKRQSKEVTFIELSDGSSFRSIQVVADFSSNNPNSVENIDVAKKSVDELTTGSSIEITGKLTQSQGEQDREILLVSIKVISIAPSDYPLQKKRHSFEFLREEIPHLRPRTNTFMAVNLMRNHIAMEIHKFFQERGFLWISTPIITTQDGEGGSAMFQVTTLDLDRLKTLGKDGEKDIKIDYKKDYFKSKSFLNVTGQLEVETLAHVHDRVYTFGPTFRAENFGTTRHLSEFWMVEPEISFIDLKDLTSIIEDFIRHLVKGALARKDEMQFFDSFIEKGVIEKLNALVNSKFHVCTYTDAVNELVKHNDSFEFKVAWGDDLQKEHEVFITDKMFGGNPVMVVNYPKKIKAFYMKLNDNEEVGRETVQGVDLLVPRVGEIIGGSIREEREHVLRQKITEFGLHEKDYWWYLDLRKFGSVPHGGFGLGFERVLMYLTGITNIRDVIPYPRTPGNIKI